MYKRQHLVIVASQIGQVAVGQVACQVTAAVHACARPWAERVSQETFPGQCRLVEISACNTPVSYTHLDVYKRQHLVIVASQIGQVAVGQVACQVTAAVHACARPWAERVSQETFPGQCRLVEISACNTPVSYTHLDVYKRQHLVIVASQIGQVAVGQVACQVTAAVHACARPWAERVSQETFPGQCRLVEISACNTPVSYTHLDVYKRQHLVIVASQIGQVAVGQVACQVTAAVHACARPWAERVSQETFPGQCRLVEISACNTPVSYTHLDVYKRQHLVIVASQIGQVAVGQVACQVTAAVHACARPWAERVSQETFPGQCRLVEISACNTPVSYTHLDVYKRQHLVIVASQIGQVAVGQVACQVTAAVHACARPWAERVSQETFPGQCRLVEISACNTPVSYTHLDVYKRQHLVIVASQIGQVAVGQVACQVTAAVHACARPWAERVSQETFPGQCRLVEISACNTPVSYTHLDVYKRQGAAAADRQRQA
ncbi:hypothetical protein [Erwinia amylovora]